MKITKIEDKRAEEWNELVAQEPSLSLQQSWQWGEFKKKLGWKAFRIAVEEQGKLISGAQMLIKSTPLGLSSIAYIPRGPVGNWLDDKTGQLLFSKIHKIARSFKSAYLKIEPSILDNKHHDQRLRDFNFRISSYTNQPRATIILDITPSLDIILKQMHQKTRYNIRYAQKKGVTVREGSIHDLKTLACLMQELGRKADFKPRKFEYLRHEFETFSRLGLLKLFVASFQNKVLAINMSALFGKHAVYLHGASSGENRNLMPNYLAMWEAVQWAKSNNCNTFDLWGIPEEVGLAATDGKQLTVPDTTKDLWGVYRFKRGFCKNVVFYTSAYDYPYNNLLYKITSNKYLNSRLLERIAIWMDSINNH